MHPGPSRLFCPAASYSKSGAAGECKLVWHRDLRNRTGGLQMLTVCMRLTCLLSCALAALGMNSLSAFSAEVAKPPSAVEGYALAQKLCKGCHLIDHSDDAVAQVGPPSFASIANKPGQTADRIKGALIQPHPPMPDMHLSNQEMLNIIAYLESLRTNKEAPSLLPPKDDSKPKMPTPG